MIGAYVGINGIPSYMVKKVLRYDCSDVSHNEDFGRMRPEFLSVNKHLIKNVKYLLKCMPTGDTVTIN